MIAANLLWRLHEAGRLTKPALFLCDRDELRSQAYDKLARSFPMGAVRIVKTEKGDNAAKNAKVHIATYHTLGLGSMVRGAAAQPERDPHRPDRDTATPRHRGNFVCQNTRRAMTPTSRLTT